MSIIRVFKATVFSCSVPVIFSLVLILVTQLSIPPIMTGENERFTYGLAGSLIAFLIVFNFLKRDNQLRQQYSLVVNRTTMINLIIGAVAGLLLAASMVGAQVMISGLQVEVTISSLSKFMVMSLSLLPLAFMEELAFRSYPFFKLRSTYGVLVAQLVMAVLFAAYHYVGGWSLYSSVLGPFVWSFAFGWLALKSNGIALPTGFHFGLNLALAVIGDKDWVPGLISITFANEPTNAQIAANEWVGAILQGFVFIGFLVLTFRYSIKEKASSGAFN
jgi:membrane protease YdiL (CAAX protease family)